MGIGGESGIRGREGCSGEGVSQGGGGGDVGWRDSGGRGWRGKEVRNVKGIRGQGGGNWEERRQVSWWGKDVSNSGLKERGDTQEGREG